MGGVFGWASGATPAGGGPAPEGGGGSGSYAYDNGPRSQITELTPDYGPFSGRVLGSNGVIAYTQDSGDGKTDVVLAVDSSNWFASSLLVVDVDDNVIAEGDARLSLNAAPLGYGHGLVNGMAVLANGGVIRFRMGGDIMGAFNGQAQAVLNVLHVESGAWIQLRTLGSGVVDHADPHLSMYSYSAANNGGAAPHVAFDMDGLAADPTTLPLLANGIYLVMGTIDVSFDSFAA